MINCINIVKRIGRFFIKLQQQNDDCLSQKILLVDSPQVWLGHLNSAIIRTKKIFPNGNIFVLTNFERKTSLEAEFDDLSYILFGQNNCRSIGNLIKLIRAKKYNFDFVLLISLDFTFIAASLICLKKIIYLYNQWGQWWKVSFRDALFMFKRAYYVKKKKSILIEFISRVGLFFVCIRKINEDDLCKSYFLRPDKKTVFKDIECAINKIKLYSPYSKVYCEAIKYKKNILEIHPDIIFVDKNTRKSFLKDASNIIVFSLSLPIIFDSFISKKSRLLLFNRWHQWWKISFKNLRDYLISLLSFLGDVFIFIFLIMRVSIIFLKRMFFTVDYINEE
ncbi:MAG: hypothetical protein P9L96_03120 [Candidatus Gygaella obscura]|nr:hypothetical protein [Candidatus Gygaella obscura]